MKSQQINKKENDIKAQKILMNYLLSAVNALQFQIKRISQAHHSKKTNAVIVMKITFTESVFIYFLLLYLNTEFQKLR